MSSMQDVTRAESIEESAALSVDEVPEADDVRVYRHKDCVVLMIDGTPVALPRRLATATAWDLVATLQAMSH